MKKIFLLFTFLEFAFFSWAQTLIISEVADPENYNLRFVQLYNASTDTVNFDTTAWFLCRQANGSATAWDSVQLSGVVPPGGVYVVAANASAFESTYGFAPNLESEDVITGNGDDGYYLFKDGGPFTGVRFDSYGQIDTDGTGTAWEYTNSYAVRNYSSCSAKVYWNAADWTVGGNSDPGILLDPAHHICACPYGKPASGLKLELFPNTYYPGITYYLRIYAVDSAGRAAPVTQNTVVDLKYIGSGNLTGTLSATIDSGAYQTLVSFDYDTVGTVKFYAIDEAAVLANSDTVPVTFLPIPTITQYPYERIVDQNTDFNADGWRAYTYAGNSWQVSSYYGDYFYRVSNWNSATSSYDTINTWLLSPKFHRDTLIGLRLSFGNAAYAASPNPKVYYSTDYPGTGDPSQYTWTEITGINWSDTKWIWVNSGKLDLTGIKKDFFLAFVFAEPAGTGNTEEIDSIKLEQYPIYPATKVKVTSVIPPNPIVQSPFTVTIQTIDTCSGLPQGVDSTTVIKLAVVKGSDTIQTLPDTLLPGQSQAVFKCVYSKAEQIKFIAEVVSGQPLKPSDTVTAKVYLPTISTYPYVRVYDSLSTIYDGGWQVFTFEGNDWAMDSLSGDRFLQISNYSRGSYSAINSWYLSPKFIMPQNYNLVLNFLSKGYNGENPPKVVVSTDYPGYGDPRNYTWKELKNIRWAQGQGWTQWMASLPHIIKADSVFYLAFVYNYPAGSGSTWELDSIVLDTMPLNLKPSVLKTYAVSPQLVKQKRDFSVQIVTVDTAGNILPVSDTTYAIRIKAINGQGQLVGDTLDTIYYGGSWIELPLLYTGYGQVQFIISATPDSLLSDTLNLNILPLYEINSFPYQRLFTANPDPLYQDWQIFTKIGHSWTVQTTADGISYLYVSNFNGATYDTTNTWYVSPLVVPPQDKVLQLSFGNAAQYGGDEPEVMISSDYPGYGLPWNYNWQELSGFNWSSGSWIWVNSGTKDIDLSKPFYLAFVYDYEDGTGNSWKLDTIKLQVKSVSAVEALNNNIQVYPNPVTNRIYISGINRGQVQIIDQVGRIVLQKQINSMPVINVSQLNSGIYILRIRTKSGIFVRKFIKQ